METNKKTVAAVLAILLGAYGGHHFYLGAKKKGIKALMISLFTFSIGAMVMGIIGIVDGVKIFKMTDEEFDEYCEMEALDEPASAGSSASQRDDVPMTDEQRNELLSKYKELFDNGALTAEEYDALKNGVLK